ncbi:MAG: hypothetical protein IJY61_08550 [Candidatus Gastranaerophilales bacterium]|nr:hypothetical protein [Candidatus Gastranaerophilales bacterium]
MINKNLISEYLMSNEYQCTSLNLYDNIQTFNENKIIKENSIFGFGNCKEENIQNFINCASGKDSIEMNDEISQLFSSFCRNDEYLIE